MTYNVGNDVLYVTRQHTEVQNMRMTGNRVYPQCWSQQTHDNHSYTIHNPQSTIHTHSYTIYSQHIEYRYTVIQWSCAIVKHTHTYTHTHIHIWRVLCVLSADDNRGGPDYHRSPVPPIQASSLPSRRIQEKTRPVLCSTRWVFPGAGASWLFWQFYQDMRYSE